MQLSLGLALALISAIAVNWAYSREHERGRDAPVLAAATGPVRLAPARRPRWLIGFATETAGWLVYVAALRLAPLSLVQAVCASGIAVLAFATTHGHPARLARHEQIAVLIAFAGLVLLSFSLVDTQQADHPPDWAPVVLWLGCSAGAASRWRGRRRARARGRARPCRRTALRRRRHLGQARRLRRHLVRRRHQPGRLLRARHKRPPGSLPAR